LRLGGLGASGLEDMVTKKRRWLSTVTAVVVLVPIIAFVVYTSFHVSEYECEVCMSFEGREVCRTVTGQTKEEGLRSGTDNACALLASGVTDSMRCTRSAPTRASCRSAH
jgi:hypothetical protein